MATRQIGEVWAYRERDEPGSPFVPAKILQLGPGTSRKAKVRFLGGEYEGLDTWVFRLRLIIPWDEDEVRAWLRDEAAYAAAGAAEGEVLGNDEAAAERVMLALAPDVEHVIGQSPFKGREAVTAVRDVPALAAALGIDPDELRAEALAFVGRHGTWVAPLPVAVRLAKRMAERWPQRVLAAIEAEEKMLRELAVSGDYVKIGYYNRERVFRGPEEYADDLADLLPTFETIRAWCGAGERERWDEAGALRAEIERRGDVIRRAADLFRQYGHPVHARQFLAEIGEAKPLRYRTIQARRAAADGIRRVDQDEASETRRSGTRRFPPAT